MWIHSTYQSYFPTSNRIDVALLKLDRAIILSSRVAAIPLCASARCFSAGTIGVVSGYGATQARGLSGLRLGGCAVIGWCD